MRHIYFLKDLRDYIDAYLELYPFLLYKISQISKMSYSAVHKIYFKNDYIFKLTYPLLVRKLGIIRHYYKINKFKWYRMEKYQIEKIKLNEAFKRKVLLNSISFETTKSYSLDEIKEIVKNGLEKALIHNQNSNKRFKNLNVNNFNIDGFVDASIRYSADVELPIPQDINDFIANINTSEKIISKKILSDIIEYVAIDF